MFFPDRMAVKSEMGFMVETTDSVTSVFCQCGFKCVVWDQLPGSELKLFLAPLIVRHFIVCPQQIVHSVTRELRGRSISVCTLIKSRFFFLLRF